MIYPIGDEWWSNFGVLDSHVTWFSNFFLFSCVCFPRIHSTSTRFPSLSFALWIPKWWYPERQLLYWRFSHFISLKKLLHHDHHHLQFHYPHLPKIITMSTSQFKRRHSIENTNCCANCNFRIVIMTVSYFDSFFSLLRYSVLVWYFAFDWVFCSFRLV